MNKSHSRKCIIVFTLILFTLLFSFFFVTKLKFHENYEHYLSQSLSNFYRSDLIREDATKGIDYVIQLFNQYYAISIFQSQIVERISRDNDYDWLRDVLIQVRLRMTSQTRIMHIPSKIPDFILGMGFCDQVNSIAAQVLSKYVFAAEVYSLRYPDGRSPHSIARIKFKPDDSWLYLDIWSGFIVAFRKDEGFPVSIIFSQKVLYDEDDYNVDKLRELYNSGLDFGFTLSVIRKSFPEQVLSKLGTKLGLLRVYQPLFVERRDPFNLMCSNSDNALERDFLEYLPPPKLEYLVDDRIAQDYFHARIKLIGGANGEALEIFHDLLMKVSSRDGFAPETTALISTNILKIHALLDLDN